MHAVHRVKDEIDRLKKQQSDALTRAIYLGMTTDEAKEFDERQRQIRELLQELTLHEEETMKVPRKTEPMAVFMEECQSLLDSLRDEAIALPHSTPVLAADFQKITDSTGHIQKGHLIPFPKDPS